MRAVSCRKATRIVKRRDEAGNPYRTDVEDEVMVIVELDDDVLVQIDSSWASRVKRDDMLTLQIDGTTGSAVVTLHDCYMQPLTATPKPIWNVDVRQNHDFDAQWQRMPDVEVYKNSYRCGWEAFLRDVAGGTPFPSPLLAGAKGLQFVDACHRSHDERRWIDLPELKL